MIINKGTGAAGGVDSGIILAAVAGKFGQALLDGNGDPIDWTDGTLLGAPTTVVPGATAEDPVTLRPTQKVGLVKATSAAIIAGTAGYFYLSPKSLAQAEEVAELGEKTGEVWIDANDGWSQSFIAVGAVTIMGVLNAKNGRRITVMAFAADDPRDITFGGETQFAAGALPGGANPVVVATTECFIFDIVPNTDAAGTKFTFIRNTDRVTAAALSAPIVQFAAMSPAVGALGDTFSIVGLAMSGNPAPEAHFAWKRNLVATGPDALNYTPGAGQQGLLECSITAVNSQGSSAPYIVKGRSGRLIPSYVGETWAMHDMSSGSTASEILLAAGSEAGQMCFIDATFQAISNFAFPDGFNVVGYVANINTATENLYRKGWAWKIIRPADALAGKMLADDDTTPLTLTIPANSSFLTATIKDATSVDWDGTFTRSELAGANAIDLKTRNVLNCLLGISVASGSYNTHALTASAPDYDLPAGLTNPAGGFTAVGRKGSRILWRPVGAGTLGARTISTSGAANQTLTTATLCFLADPD